MKTITEELEAIVTEGKEFCAGVALTFYITVTSAGRDPTIPVRVKPQRRTIS
jgi:hypothetical protein